jgi:DNA-binding response OmpR family regulator
MVSGDTKAKEKDEEKKQLGRIILKRRPAAEIRALASREPREQLVSKRPVERELAPNDPRHAELVLLSERFGVPALDLLQLCLSTGDLDAVPQNMAEQHLLVPVLVRADRLFLAMKDPSQHEVIREIEFLSGKRVYAYAAKEEEIAQVIEVAYECKRQGESHYVGPSCPPETLRKAGLPPDRAPSMRYAPEPSPSLEAPVIIPAPPLMPASLELSPAARITEAETARLDSERPLAPIGELLTSDAVLPGTVSAYPPRASSLPPALRRHTSEPSDDPAELFAEMEDAFEQLTDEPSMMAPLPREPSEDAAAEGKSRTILVVDDSVEIRDLLQRALRDDGYEVLLAENGQRALQMIKDSTPDLIVLDAMLPEVHGFEIARRLRKSQRYGDVPIVMVSAVYRGWRFAEDLRESCGIEHYIEKPFRLADVKRAVQAALLERPRERAAHAGASESSASTERALEQGVEAFHRGDTALAIEHLERGVAIDPLAFRLHFHLGLLYAKQGRTFEAISALERAVEIDSRHFAGVKNLAIMYYQAGFRHRAAELWERGLNLAPDEATRNAIKEHLVGLLS